MLVIIGDITDPKILHDFKDGFTLADKDFSFFEFGDDIFETVTFFGMVSFT